MIKSWLSESKKSKRKTNEKILQEALDSTDALEKAARGTMSLAQDVTTSLQTKIDDYSKQIDQMSRLLGDALFHVDESGKIESFNPAAEEMFGWKKRQIVGQPISKLFQFKEGTDIDSGMMECLLGKVGTLGYSNLFEDFMGVKACGEMIYIEVKASKITLSSRVFYIILVRDETTKVNQLNRIRDLAEKNQDLLTTIDSSHTGICIVKKDQKNYQITFVNEGFANFADIPRDMMIRQNLDELLSGEKGFSSLSMILENQIEDRCEICLPWESVKENWFEVQVTPVFKKGLADQWILIFYDITQIKKINQELKNQQAHFRAFSDASSESMLIHDGKENLHWNERLSTLTGYTELDLKVLHPLDFLHPLKRTNSRNFLLPEGPVYYETLFLTKGGEVIEVALDSRPIEWKGSQAQIVIIRDITAFKSTNQMKSTRERYKTVIENTIDMVVCFDADFKITFSNQTFRDYYSIEIEDLSESSILNIIPASDHENFKEYKLSITPDQEIRRGLHRVKYYDEIRWQDWIDRGIFDSSGNLIEIQSVARDVTHLMNK